MRKRIFWMLIALGALLASCGGESEPAPAFVGEWTYDSDACRKALEEFSSSSAAKSMGIDKRSFDSAIGMLPNTEGDAVFRIKQDGSFEAGAGGKQVVSRGSWRMDGEFIVLQHETPYQSKLWLRMQNDRLEVVNPSIPEFRLPLRRAR